MCGVALRRTSVGAGRQAGDRLARADECGRTGRCGGPLRADSWTDPRRGGSGRSTQRHHPRSRPGATECARQGRVRRDLRAGEARRSRKSLARPPLSGGQSRERTGDGERRGRHHARQRLAGRRDSDRDEPDDRRSRRTQEGRLARDRPRDRPFLRSSRRRAQRPDSACLARNAPAIPPRRSRRDRRDADVAHPGELRRAAGRETDGAACGLGVRRLREYAVAGQAGSFAHLRQGRVPRRPFLRTGLHGEGSAGAGRRTGRHARYRLVLPPCEGGCLGHAESSGRRRRSHDQPRRLAVGQFHPDGSIHLGFNQDTQNRIVWDGAFAAGCAARQTPINLRFGLPGGAAGMYRARQRRRRLVDALRGQGA